MAQTASIQPREPLDCSFPGAVVLPQSETFGGGEPPSVLVSSTYGADAGPGLYLTARDAFRVLLNGELVVESEEARETVFVQLTLLPGDNVLAVVVAADSGTPAALLRIDELDRSYESDSAWKVSTRAERRLRASGIRRFVVGRGHGFRRGGRSAGLRARRHLPRFVGGATGSVRRSARDRRRCCAR